MATAVVIFTTPFCGYCHVAKRLLSKKGVAFREVDVAARPPLRRWLVGATGRRTVPQIFLHGRSIGGYRELAAHERAGSLDRLLAEPPPPEAESFYPA